jgi:hypothetical protein
MNVKEEIDERSEVLYAVRWTSVKDTCLVRKEITLKIKNL